MELTNEALNTRRSDLKREHAELWRRLTMSYEYGRIREIEALLKFVEELVGPDETPDPYAPNVSTSDVPASERPPTEAGY